MRRVAFITVAIALVAIVALSALSALRDRDGGGAEICRGLDHDLELALTNPPKPDDRDELIELGWGFCNIARTSKVDVHVPGVVERHTESFVQARFESDPWERPARMLRRTRRLIEKREPGHRIEPVPSLGSDAFADFDPDAVPAAPTVTPDPSFDGQTIDDPFATPDVSPYRVTVYWRRGYGLLNAAATRDGADDAEVRRITVRFAELINRRPMNTSNFAP